MTIKQLKQKLEEFKDDQKVVICCDQGESDTDPLGGIDIFEIKKIKAIAETIFIDIEKG